MRPLAVSLISGAMLLGVNLARPVRMEAAPLPPSLLQSGQAAYATSLPFDLEPHVERASIALRRPNVRSLYNAVAQAYGIRLLYDRDLREIPIASDFHLQDATLPEALQAAGSISRTFVAPLDPRTGIVAADTPEKRGEYERQVLGSFYMDDQTTPQQLTEISTVLRNLLDLRRVTQDTRTNWITVRGRARQVAAAEQFVRTLQKPNGEVMLEVQVWEVNTSRARELGILPPQPFQLLYLGESGTGSGVPLRILGQRTTLYGISLSGLLAILNSSSSLVRSHQVFHLRASDGQRADFRTGQRFPVITSILSPSFEPGGASQATLSSSGFFPAIQYEDLGVVVQATPYLHAGRELTLQLDLALRSLGPRDQNGLPTFGNRQITGQVRLRDGESFLLGGVLSRSDQNGVSGYPWLSRLPLLGALFSRRLRQQQETELILLVRPRVLRFDPAEEIASRSIFFGRELTGLPGLVEPAPEQPPPGVPPQPVVPLPGFPPGVAPVPGVPPQPGVPPRPGFPFPGVFPGIAVPPGVLPQPVPPQPPEI